MLNIVILFFMLCYPFMPSFGMQVFLYMSKNIYYINKKVYATQTQSKYLYIKDDNVCT